MSVCSTIAVLVFAGAIPCMLAQGPATMVPATSGVGNTAAANGGSNAYTIPAGTRIPLVLKNEISTRIAMPGDPVYLMSDFPVVENGSVVLPAGLYVRGIIDSVQRPGKVKGRAQLQMHFASIILPNGVEISLPGSLDKVSSSNGAKVKNAEGTVEQAGTKGKDTEHIASTTLAGAGVGGLVGYGTGDVARGTGIGAGAGAAVGLLTTLFTRGNDVVIPSGTALEMEVTKAIVLQQAQLTGMPASSGMNMQPQGVAQPLPQGSPKPN